MVRHAQKRWCFSLLQVLVSREMLGLGILERIQSRLRPGSWLVHFPELSARLHYGYRVVQGNLGLPKSRESPAAYPLAIQRIGDFTLGRTVGWSMKASEFEDRIRRPRI